jgi:hypothetical protein
MNSDANNGTRIVNYNPQSFGPSTILKPLLGVGGKQILAFPEKFEDVELMNSNNFLIHIDYIR